MHDVTDVRCQLCQQILGVANLVSLKYCDARCLVACRNQYSADVHGQLTHEAETIGTKSPRKAWQPEWRNYEIDVLEHTVSRAPKVRSRDQITISLLVHILHTLISGWTTKFMRQDSRDVNQRRGRIGFFVSSYRKGVHLSNHTSEFVYLLLVGQWSTMRQSAILTAFIYCYWSCQSDVCS